MQSIKQTEFKRHLKLNRVKLQFNVCRKEVQRPETDGHIAFKSFNDVMSTTDYTTRFASFLEVCRLTTLVTDTVYSFPY